MTRGRITNITIGVAAAIFAAIGLESAAAEYPEHPIRLIVPYPAGGGADIITRHFAARLEGKLGRPVVVENVTGAAGGLGAQRVATSASDGYTLLFGGNAELVIRNLLQPSTYDTFRDFTAISLIGSGPMVLLGKPGLPAETLEDVIAMARNRPGALSYGSGGQGTPMHLVGEAVKSKAHLDIRHIPYRGAPPVLADVTAGHIDLGIVTLAAALPLIESGKARAYAVTSLKRVEFAPKIPALSETSELAGLMLEFWGGLFGPANLPTPIRATLEAKTAEVLDDPELKAKLAGQAFAIRKLSGQTFTAFIVEDYERTKKIIADGNISVSP